MAFEQLIADMQGMADDLTKSQTGDAGDAVIQAAGATGGDSNGGGEGGDGLGASGNDTTAGGGDEGGEGSEGGDLSKSFEVELSDGTKFKAVDATEMLKALTGRIDGLESGAGEALTMCVTMMKSLVADNATLHAAMRKLAGTGSGRQAVLAILPKGDTTGGSGTLVKSEQGMKPQDFLMKAETAYNAKALTGGELGMVETCLNRGEQVPAHLIQKVMGAAGAVA